ncbi:hypothetical protein ACFY2R_15595 [Micromonospora olivasterospora]|uniref:Uncharacterized protein n=1 Tax=Micromonospora olivasterospora TaxID=1880 RepID=A0A562IH38_MICOL|nr:hypothetical protein [Micromonospora olivasterospora]TWH70212.1 hypothetical protein JD77_05233 [Micromonospora olivasterospora]
MIDDGYFGDEVAARYDDPTSEMFAPNVVGATVDVLAELAGPWSWASAPDASRCRSPAAAYLVFNTIMNLTT